MILEGIVTTINGDGSVNISPMGPIVDPSMKHFILRPYQSSTTYHNLKSNRQGVLHVTDDVELLARTAVNRLDDLPEMFPAKQIDGQVLADACRWYELRVAELNDDEPRTRIECEVLHAGQIRDFFGFNRAKHAVLEAAILATRTDFLPPQQILEQFEQLAIIVEKTAGEQERAAFSFLDDHVRGVLDQKTRKLECERSE